MLQTLLSRASPASKTTGEESKAEAPKKSGGFFSAAAELFLSSANSTTSSSEVLADLKDEFKEYDPFDYHLKELVNGNNKEGTTPQMALDHVRIIKAIMDADPEQFQLAADDPRTSDTLAKVVDNFLHDDSHEARELKICLLKILASFCLCGGDIIDRTVNVLRSGGSEIGLGGRFSEWLVEFEKVKNEDGNLEEKLAAMQLVNAVLRVTELERSQEHDEGVENKETKESHAEPKEKEKDSEEEREHDNLFDDDADLTDASYDESDSVLSLVEEFGIEEFVTKSRAVLDELGKKNKIKFGPVSLEKEKVTVVAEAAGEVKEPEISNKIAADSTETQPEVITASELSEENIHQSAHKLAMMIDIYDMIVTRAEGSGDQGLGIRRLRKKVLGTKGEKILEAFEEALEELIRSETDRDSSEGVPEVPGEERDIAVHAFQILMDKLNGAAVSSSGDLFLPPPPPPGGAPPTASTPGVVDTSSAEIANGGDAVPPPPLPGAPPGAEGESAGSPSVSGGVVAPPPPPGDPNVAVVKKTEEIVRPPKEHPKVERKMKNFLWAKLKDSETIGTIWGPRSVEEADSTGVSDESILVSEQDMSELQTLFGVAPRKVVMPTGTDPPSTVEEHDSDSELDSISSIAPVVTQEEEITVLNQRRAQNMMIVLKRRFRGYSVQAIAAAVKEGKPQSLGSETKRQRGMILTEENIQALIPLVPTDEDRVALEPLQEKLNENPNLRVGVAERFCLEMMKIPRVEKKLEWLLFTREFQSKARDISHSMKRVRAATIAVRDSDALKSFLAIVLKFGNIMNSGTSRGAAYGFKISSLPKLTEVKPVMQNEVITDEQNPSNTISVIKDDKTKPKSLLHYLVAKMEQEEATKPEWARGTNYTKLRSELGALEPVASTSMATNLANEVNEIRAGMRIVESDLTMAEKSEGGAEDESVRDLKAWYEEAKKIVDRMEESFTRLKEEETEMVRYVGEGNARKDPGDAEIGKSADEVFSVVWTTLVAMEAAKKENDDLRRAQRRREGVQRMSMEVNKGTQARLERMEQQIQQEKSKIEKPALFRRDTLTHISDGLESGEIFKQTWTAQKKTPKKHKHAKKERKTVPILSVEEGETIKRKDPPNREFSARVIVKSREADRVPSTRTVTTTTRRESPQRELSTRTPRVVSPGSPTQEQKKTKGSLISRLIHLKHSNRK